MRYTFTYESEKHESKTVTLSFDGVGGEKAILRNFLDFMKAVGHTYDKNEILKVVNENESSLFYNNYFSGLSGTSGKDFSYIAEPKKETPHSHGMRGPFVGPADC